MKNIWGVIGLCLLSMSANATLVSASGGQAYYDTATNLTWVADANLAQTSGYDADGLMDWTAAVAWAASLNAQNAGLGYLGVTNWRLPTVTDTGTPGCVGSAFTGTDCGYNVDLATGEMARMFYSTLGNTAAFNTSGVQQPCFPNLCLTNTGPFSNLQSGTYWSGTQYAPDTSQAWQFSFNSGIQQRVGKVNTRYAWAVSSGNSLNATVPVPPAVWLFGSALGVMGVMRRKIT